MKKTKVLLMMALVWPGVNADVLVMADGTTMQVHNIEPASKWIYYTESPDADAPIRKVAVDKVFAYKIGDGAMTTVAPAAAAPQEPAESADPAAPRRLDAVPAADNTAAIAAYNSPEIRLKKPKSETDKLKYCTDFITLWGIGSESVLSDGNVSISFRADVKKIKGRFFPYYKIKVTNKTDGPVYIDLANSFRLGANGSAEPYFTGSVYSESSTKSRGIGLNLGAVTGALGIGGAAGTLAGGIGIGQGSSNTATITSQEQRILMIPPRASVYMPPVKFSNGSKIIDQFDVFFFRTTDVPKNSMGVEGDFLRFDESRPYFNAMSAPGALDDAEWNRDRIAAPLGWPREFTEADSPKKLMRLITYSTNQDFSTYTVLPVSIFLRGVVGSSQRWNVPKDYNPAYFECSDENHLIWGLGQVRKQ